MFLTNKKFVYLIFINKLLSHHTKGHEQVYKRQPTKKYD